MGAKVRDRKLSAFTWGVLALNLAVILWGPMFGPPIPARGAGATGPYVTGR